MPDDQTREPDEPTAAPSAEPDPSVVVPGAGTPDGPGKPDSAPDDAVTRDGSGVPDEATLARVATPGVVRRAPRFGAFIAVGAILGLVAGLVLAAAFDRGDLAGEGGGVLPFLGGSNGARLVTGVALAGVGALVGAALALWADARSRRRAR